ncbi:MAG: FecR domain-containing protein [Gammaproteobacteria bacterium]
MNRSGFWRILISLAVIVSPPDSFANNSCSLSIGKFLSIEGTVEVAHSDQGTMVPAKLDTVLCQDDTIHVGQNSRAAVQLINEVMLRLDQNSTMRLIDVAPQPEKKSLIELIAGAFKSFSRPPRTFEVNTPYINGIIEGTEFAMRVGDGSTLVTVYEGKVNTRNEHGKLLLAKGESALAKPGEAPKPYLLVNPRDAVQWTLYYPPLLSALGGGMAQIPADAPAAVREALAMAAHGDTPGALGVLERVPDTERSAQYYLYRAALFLEVGRVDEARSDIDRALGQDPKAGLGYALRSVIGLTRNQKSEALSDAEKAVQLSPSPASQIALSYAQQAEFRLADARDTLLSAVKNFPEDPLAWARLAELHLMFGERDEALEAARKAEQLAPALARTQTVLGFAALAENRESDAKAAFEKAIGLASDDPLAHFGLGLASIKSGDLAAGRAELEGATALDSSNALLRSYLGKAYYEEKRFPLEGQQYGLAKELDPSDPTPYFYDAIDKQTTNRPVEALHDMQKAIELNNNRAVFRSKQLLDSDVAARSAAIGRVYTDLGFQQRGLLEGWKSANTDPTSFSAHRFLADSYAALPRHEIARVSELLQSQLLQPINMTPIQPRLAESNLFLISAGGPGSTSFNEFNPLFNRDGLTFQSSGVFGQNDTYAGEGIVAGIYKNASFSLGYSHFETAGRWRSNTDQNDDIGNALFQFELSPDTSIQAEYRYRDTKVGDLTLRFFPEYVFGQRNEIQTHTYRAGVRHNFTPDSIVLGSFMYQKFESSQANRQFPIPGLLAIDFSEPGRDSFSGETQHLFRSEYLNLTSGFGYFYVDGQDNQTILLGPPIVPPFIPSPVEIMETTKELVRHVNAYSYAQIKPLHNLITTIGLSYDNIGGQFVGDVAQQWNPKFGIVWEPLQGTTLRAAAFRSLKRTLVTNQTLEPTQVAGFNQFFDDINRTEAWNYGGGVDQIFTKNIYGGLEFSYRDLQVPFTVVSTSGQNEDNVDWKEYLGRAYLFWTPDDWLALRAQYFYEGLNRDDRFPEGAIVSHTHRVPLSIGFFHPSGLSTAMTANYISQDGQFGNVSGFFPVRAASDSFWTFDAVISYRLPKRYGFLSFGGTNLFNNKFNFFDSDPNNPSIQPGRILLGRVTLQIP